jgi:hypothetical protein
VDRIGKLFLVLDPVNRRCLCCDGVFTRQQARNHAQVPCRPAQNAVTGELCESSFMPSQHDEALASGTAVR